MKTILVVEDDRLLARLVQINLVAEGYNVLIYNDGAKAMAYLSENRPDLILLDLMLSTVSGWDILRHAQSDAKLVTVPILAVTALAQKAEEQRTLQEGASRYLVKPFGINQLLKTVAELLDY
jgi:DNA-binding response OmpR family regulator